MRFTRAMTAFVAVAALWALFVWLFARRLVNDSDIVPVTALGAAYGMVWQGLVNMAVYAVRKVTKTELTAVTYMAAAVVVSSVLAFLVDLLLTANLAGAVELALGAAVAGLVSALVFIVVAGIPWRR